MDTVWKDISHVATSCTHFEFSVKNKNQMFFIKIG